MSKEDQAFLHGNYAAITLQSLENPSFQTILKSLHHEELLRKGVELFVGDREVPSCKEASFRLFDLADSPGLSQARRNRLLYFKFYCERVNAVEQGLEKEFELANEQLFILAQKGHPVACHLIGKDLYYNRMQLTEGDRRQQRDLIEKAALLFQRAIEGGFFLSYYYLGLIAEKGDLGRVDLDEAFDCFSVAAAMDSSKACFKLSEYYKEGKGKVKRNQDLYYKYLKRAAENGLPEAIHNFGCLYLEGKEVQRDRLRAFAWFLAGTERHFSPSIFNQAIILAEGIDDGLLIPNYEAALIVAEQLAGLPGVELERVREELRQKVQEREGRRSSAGSSILE